MKMEKSNFNIFWTFYLKCRTKPIYDIQINIIIHISRVVVISSERSGALVIFQTTFQVLHPNHFRLFTQWAPTFPGDLSWVDNKPKSGFWHSRQN